MPYDAKKALEETKILERTDPSGETFVVIRQSKGREDLRRADALFNNYPPIGWYERRALECWLTFAGTSITIEGESFGDPDKLRGNYAAFLARFDVLDKLVTAEWQTKVWEVNPNWHPQVREAVNDLIGYGNLLETTSEP